MDHSLLSEQTPGKKTWPPEEILTEKPDWQDRLLGWWYRLTTVPEPPAQASFAKRDAARRARLFSTVAFFFLLILALFFPASAFLPNHLVIYVDGLLMGLVILTLFINRGGQFNLAGSILVIASELALTAVILTTTPFDETSIQYYDLYLVVSLLAVSLLPPQTVFVLAVVNSLFIYFDLLYQPHTQVLTNDLLTQFLPVLVRPVALQIIIAGVAYLWVRNATRAITRAERAEMVARLEHTISEERASFEQANRQLEESIQWLVKTHAEAMNGQTIAKIPYPLEAKMLWPLIGVINSLWMRLQHAHQTQQELRNLRQAIASYTEVIHQTMQAPQQLLPPPPARTDLDALIIAMRNLQRALREQ